MKIENIVFDLEELIENIFDLMSVQIKKDTVELNYDIAPGLHCLRIGDPNRIRQVLTNLVSNAIKFTPAGKITIEIQDYPEQKDALLFSVMDTGVGIDSDKLESLFRPFTQEDESTSRKVRRNRFGSQYFSHVVSADGRRNLG